MNKELKKKEKELEITKNILAETLIISQQKYTAYLDEQKRLEHEIYKIKEDINKPKITKTWIETEDGWRKRVYKYE